MTTPSTFDTTTVGEVMRSNLITCSTATPLTDVAALMTEHRVHSVLVTWEGSAGEVVVWGLVSDLDLVRAALRQCADESAGDLGLAPLTAVHPDATLVDAAETMLDRGVRHLLVTDRLTHRPVGIVSSLDLAGAITSRDAGPVCPPSSAAAAA